MYSSQGKWHNLQGISCLNSTFDATAKPEVADCQWPGISSLRIPGTGLNADIIRLFGKACGPQIHDVDLSFNRIDAGGIRILLQWHGLQTVKLAGMGLGVDAVQCRSLGEWPYLRHFLCNIMHLMIQPLCIG